MDNKNNKDNIDKTQVHDTVRQKRVPPKEKQTDLTVLPKQNAKPESYSPPQNRAKNANIMGGPNNERSKRAEGGDSYHLKGRDIKGSRQKLYDINKKHSTAGDDEIIIGKNRKAAADEPAEKEGYVFSGLLKGLLYVFVIVTVSIVLAYNFIMIANDVFAFVKSPFSVDVVVAENSTLDEVAQILYENRLIKYPKIFKTYIKYRKTDKDFIAGTYTLSSTMNYDEYVAKLRKKLDEREIVRITIPEGFTIDEIIELLVKNGIGTKDKYLEVINKNEFKYTFVKLLDDTTLSPNRKYRLEGYIFPDTYDFYKSASEIEVITKFLNNFEIKFNELFYKRCETLGLSVDEVITIASMVEREAKNIDDFPLVASVFHNRILHKDSFPYMESDATLQYSLGKHKNELFETDINLDLPYNTYKYKGLPPSAICNPGYEAIYSALYPEPTEYYYFVSDNKSHIYFAKTNAEHEENKKKAKAAAE